MFEEAICEYTGSPYCVALDSCTNAIFLSLLSEGIKGEEISCPERTYMGVVCSIIQAGGKVKFTKLLGTTIKGA